MDIFTLTVIQSLANGIQVAALYGQYRMDKTHRGPDWWTLGSASVAVGFAFNSLQKTPPFGLAAAITGNTLFLTGLALFYAGVLRFFGRREQRGWLAVSGILFVLLDIYFSYSANDHLARTVLASTAGAVLSFLISRALFVHKVRSVTASADFLAAVFLVFGLLQAVTPLATPLMPGTFAAALPQSAQLLVTFIAGTLWTFGFIVMVNQRLNVESREAKEHFELIFNTTPDAIMITQMNDGHFVDINDGFTKLTGFSRAEVIGTSCLELNLWFNPEDRHTLVNELGSYGFCENHEVLFRHKDGTPIVGMMSAESIILHETPHIISVTRDFTERKRVEKELEESYRKLEQLSITDGLTKIANRRHFDVVLAQELARHIRSGSELSLIMLDIDHFKAFNDNYGHVKGDECLQQIGRVLADCAVRPADLAARYGGEEFACILPETDSSGALIIVEKIRRGIMALAIPHCESSAADVVTASLGVVTVHCTAEKTVDDILTRADELLYRAKSSGRNRVEFDVESTSASKGNFVQLTWKESFCCGNQQIDSQHRALFHVANRLFEAVLSGHPAPEISAIIDRLLADVSQHFRDEQLILEAAGFPGLSEHINEHAKLLNQGVELSRQFDATTVTVGDIFQYLVYDMVMIHILGADREYFPYIDNAEKAG